MDDLHSMLDLGDEEGWVESRRQTVTIEPQDPVHAYFSDDGTPEDEAWLVIGRFPRRAGSECGPQFRSVPLANGTNGCVRTNPVTELRFLVDGKHTRIGGQIGTAEAVEAANQSQYDDANPTAPIVTAEGWPAGTTDQGEFVSVAGTNRSVSARLVDTELVVIEFHHTDGSTVEITSAVDDDRALAYLRLDQVGGWILTELRSVDGFVGEHRVLSDMTVVWFEPGALVQVRSTGTEGALVVERLSTALDPE